MASYSWVRGGDGWTLVPCLQTFAAEVEHCVAIGLIDVENNGELGDAVHQTEPTSRHNPARGPDGVWYVCAMDFKGRDYQLLADFHQQRYREHDARLFRYAFSQRGDGTGLTWFDGSWHRTNSDYGHCHFDVNMAGPHLNRNWWVPALAITAPWGLEAWLRNRLGRPADVSTEALSEEDDDMFTIIGYNGSPERIAVQGGRGTVLTDNPTREAFIAAGAKEIKYRSLEDYLNQRAKFCGLPKSWKSGDPYPESALLQ
jgi:hypothetical protein